jgi:RimJ/RimL family protein N-acetyltransferase
VTAAAFRLRSARLDLRPAGPGDVTEIFPAITPTLTRFLSFDPPASMEELASIVAFWPSSMAAGREIHFTIRHGDDGRFLGLCGLHAIQDRLPELGIWIRESEHGQGYGREAIAALAEWAFATLKPDGLLYPVAEQNGQSRRLIESMGGAIIGERLHRKYRALVYRIEPPRSSG